MTHETLDEVIDRVAAEMTAVSAEPAFADRVARQLAERHRPRVRLALFTAAAVSLVVLVAVLGPPQESPAPVSRELTARALAPVTPSPLGVSGNAPYRGQAADGPRATGDATGQSVPMPNDATGPATADLAVADMAVASPGPAPLVVAELTIQPVATPDAVAIAPLEIAPLDVPELRMFNESKEQK